MSDSSKRILRVALAGNPNCGKTTIFNRLTGEKRDVGNYSGVTVEMAKGRFQRDGVRFELVDLPGIYSLTTFSKDEMVAREYLLAEKPDIIVNVVDASNLERNLFLSLQLKELGVPTLIALNMIDVAKARGLRFDSQKLSEKLSLPIVEVVGVSDEGCNDLIAGILTLQSGGFDDSVNLFLSYSNRIEKEIVVLESALDVAALKLDDDPSAWDSPLGIQWLTLGSFADGRKSESSNFYAEVKNRPDVLRRRRWLALKLLEDDAAVVESWNTPEIVNLVSRSVERFSSSDGTPIAVTFAAERYANVRKICKEVVRNTKKSSVTLSDQADRLLTHPFWGTLVFLAAMFMVFWLTFTLGNYPVQWLEAGQGALGNWCNQLWSSHPDSLLRSLVVDGVIAGVGGVLVFLPNIIVLFVAISILEECGYMARGAFLTDRFLSCFGLTGKSFIPMLVGFGCSVPAVISTRIIEDKNSRLATMFVIPLMSCGARFPIYMLVIPAFFPLKWQAPILWTVYVLGIIIAAILSTIITKFAFKGETEPLLIELPPYHRPSFNTAGVKAFERSWQYIRKAGTTILGISMLFWAFSTFPTLPEDKAVAYKGEASAITQAAAAADVDLDVLERNISDDAPILLDANNPDSSIALESAVSVNEGEISLLERRRRNNVERAEAQLEYSVVGRVGKAIEPVVKFAGFDWRIGCSLVGSMAAKELFVAQMGIVYKIGETDETSVPLKTTLRNNYPPLVGVSVLIFCLIASPCMATVVVVAKESSWLWAGAQWLTLTLVGFFLATLVYQLGSLLHIGI